MADKGVLNDGFTQIPNKLIKLKELDCIEKMILINFMSYGENIYPSITRICEELNISRPTCVKKIKALKDNGYLKITKNKSLNGDYNNNSYEVVKKFNHLVKEINYGSKNNLPQVVKEINSNNTNKIILNNNIYSSNEEDSISYLEKIDREIDDLENEINNKYDKDLVTKEKEKLINKNLGTLDLLKELKKRLDKNNKKPNKEKIYMDLTFIDDVIDKVKITKEQYNTLINKFCEELVNKQILDLDNYIVNGKGNRYKDHYRVLNNWCVKNNKDKAKPKEEIKRRQTNLDDL